MINDNELYFILYSAGILFVLGIILSILARPKAGEENNLAQTLEKALPGAQCAQCGYPGCKAYAEALASGEAPCNKCTPGGQDTTNKLAQILGVNPPVDDNNADEIFTPRSVALIHESICTGCTKCTRYCPVDAIVGGVRKPHKVLENECIGCNECVKVCPENCIEMTRLEPTLANFNWDLYSIRYKERND